MLGIYGHQTRRSTPFFPSKYFLSPSSIDSVMCWPCSTEWSIIETCGCTKDDSSTTINNRSHLRDPFPTTKSSLYRRRGNKQSKVSPPSGRAIHVNLLIKHARLMSSRKVAKLGVGRAWMRCSEILDSSHSQPREVLFLPCLVMSLPMFDDKGIFVHVSFQASSGLVGRR